MISAIFSATLSFLLLYKYLALFAVTFLAAALLPLPSDSATLATGAFASQGYLNIYLVILVALLGNVLGDLAGFIISRRYGREFLVKIGFRKMLVSKIFSNLEKFLNENFGSTIFITRFIGQIGPMVNVLCGLSPEISFKKFLWYELTGELANVLLLALAGYFLGSAWQNSTLTIELSTAVFLVIIVALVFVRKYLRALRR